ALQLGLRVDAEKVVGVLGAAIREGAVGLDNPDTTEALIRAGAVVGVKGFFDERGNMRSVGITCAVCHSTVDNSLAKGIGRRLDGWPNRDLNIGAIVASAPNLQPFSDQLGADVATVKRVLLS